MTKSITIFLFTLLVGFWTGYFIHHRVHEERFKDTVFLPEHPFYLMEEVNEEVLYKTLVHYNFPEPEFITAQAILETGNFKSRLFLEKNNMFGLYNSKRMEYFEFDCWLSSCFGYKKMILKKKKKDEPMSAFCLRINYASDPSYISKVTRISNRIKEKYEAN